MSKTDQILEHIIGIERHLGKMNGHLKELNGKVKVNVTDIKTNEAEIKRINKKIAYYTGAAAVVIALFMTAIQWLFKYKL